MALRVLLADESTTIKKVMQLALQDFAVEVKSVHAGVDVLEVARAFRPDIVFADVLLQKKNGYEVCEELKGDAELKVIPVVLMWSSFMDLDEKGFRRCSANDRLEKPFDVEHLRGIVKTLVPKTQTHQLANFLKFPQTFVEPLISEEVQKQKGPEFDDEVTATGLKLNFDEIGKFTPPSSPQPPIPTMSQVPPPARPMQPPPDLAQTIPPPLSNRQPTQNPGWSMESFAQIDSFAEISHDISGEPDEDQFTPVTIDAKSNLVPPSVIPDDDDDEPWSQQSLSRFKVNLPAVDVESEEFSMMFDLNEGEFEDAKFLINKPAPPANTPAPPMNTKPPPLEPTKEEISAPKFTSEESERFSFTHLQEEAPVNAEKLTMTKSHFEIPIIDSQEAPLEFEGAPLELTEALESHEAMRPNIYDLDEAAEEFEEIEMPPDLEAHEPHAHLVSGEVPQLSADRLEEIIRSQSKEIIESVVQRIVPDIASDMIRKELDRLLRERK